MLHGVQYLRALAALSVVTYHVAQGSWPAVLQSGVDVFFVISGFIMWRVAGVDAWVFARNRVARIAPLYWVVTIVMFVGSRLAPRYFPTIYGTWQRVSDLLWSLAFVSHADMHGSHFPVVLQGWTIEIEVLFYLVMTAALLAPARLRLAIVLAGVAGLTAWWGSIASEFAAGVLIAAVPWRVPPRAGLMLTAAGMIALAFSEAGVRALVWGLPATAIVAGVIAAEPILPRFGWLRRLGDASYSIYLIHMPFVAIAGMLPVPVWAQVALALASVSLAGLVMRPVETGLQTAFRFMFEPHAKPVRAG